MSKKRKGSESDGRVIVLEEVTPTSEAKSGNIRSHFSDGLDRISKKCKEDASDESNVRRAGIATAPPCSSQSALCPLGRGLKRKIGCIEARTQTGRKNKMEDDYVKGAVIGRGKFGSVCLCRSRATGAEFACKTLRKGEDPVHREVEIMQHLSGHPGVVTLQAVYEEVECFHLVMELCSGGRLIDQMQVVGTYTEHRAANILKEVMLVVKYCHEMGVAHRDIKPENILLTSTGKIKLADFGLSMRISNGQTLSGKAGSPAYVAPEVLSGDYSEKVDIWSAGVLMHALLVGVLPFQGDTLEDVFEAIKNVKLDFSCGIWEPISKPACDLIGRMLTRDVSARMTADEVLDHPWIRFYTERTLKTLPFKSKSKNQNGPTPSPPSKASVLKHDEQKLPARSSTGSLSCKSEEQDEFGIVDALATAISRVNISEPSKSQSNMTPHNLEVLTAAISHVNISGPKRSRLCVPSSSSKQQSYMTPNNLCRAF